MAAILAELTRLIWPAPTPMETAAAFWDALYERDWERIRTFFGPSAAT